MDLLDQLQTRVLCGDGAIGTLLLEQGVPLAVCYEELCLSDPERVRAIHQQHIEAGAQVIKTNTFGANAVRLERCGFETQVGEINRAAVALARQAGNDVLVAGSVGPLGISGAEAKARGIDRGQCFREQIEALLDGGAEIIFFETFTDFEELSLAFRAKLEVADAVAICSFACATNGFLACGMPLIEACDKLRAAGVNIVGVNCMNAPEEMVALIEQVPFGYVLTIYPTAGCPESQNGSFVYRTTPDSFLRSAPAMIAKGARLIGGCCGTTPAHIKAIASAIADSR